MGTLKSWLNFIGIYATDEELEKYAQSKQSYYKRHTCMTTAKRLKRTRHRNAVAKLAHKDPSKKH